MKDNKISQLRNRIKKKLSVNTQEQIAKELGISQSYINLIIHGKRNPKNVKEILDKINALLGGDFSIN